MTLGLGPGQAQLSLRDHLARDPGLVAWSPASLPRIVGEQPGPRPNIGDPMQKLRKDLPLYLPDYEFRLLSR
jgi:hypothetical protein